MSGSSLVRRGRMLAHRLANVFNRLLVRYSGLSVLCLLITDEPAGEKASRVLQRLRYYFLPTGIDGRVRVVRSASIARIMLARIVAEVDETSLPPHLHRRFENLFNVDFEHNPRDGWELCRITQFLAGLPTESATQEARSRFQGAVRGIRSRGKTKAYVFGTGPSLAAASQRDFSDGYVVVCNTIVRDEEIWRHLKPDFIAAGDAIYHFGFTEHALAFRTDLRRRLGESNGETYFVYPDLFDALVRREFPEFRDLLIPVPHGVHRDVHVDLSERFELPALANALTVLLLPLACTLSRSVWLWGFDGRAPTDQLFWANSSRHAYPELMPVLRREHPAFFEAFVPPGRESTYHQTVHGDALDEQLGRAEAAGYEFVQMHASWTEALQKRAIAGAGRPLGAGSPLDAPRR